MGINFKAGHELCWLGKRARRYAKRIHKQFKVRQERRKAKRDPEAQDTYNRFHGYAD